jgi:hypothetical protein
LPVGSRQVPVRWLRWPEADIFAFTFTHDRHGDAMLQFETGDTLTFDGVPARQITMDDFDGY